LALASKNGDAPGLGRLLRAWWTIMAAYCWVYDFLIAGWLSGEWDHLWRLWLYGAFYVSFLSVLLCVIRVKSSFTNSSNWRPFMHK